METLIESIGTEYYIQETYLRNQAMLGQTFSTNTTLKLTKSSFYLRRVNATAGNYSSRLYEFKDGAIYGDILAESSVISYANISTTRTLIDFAFDGTCVMSPSKTYAIVVYKNGGTTLDMSFGVAEYEGYSGYTIDYDGGWAYYLDFVNKFVFYVYGDNEGLPSSLSNISSISNISQITL